MSSVAKLKGVLVTTRNKLEKAQTELIESNARAMRWQLEAERLQGVLGTKQLNKTERDGALLYQAHEILLEYAAEQRKRGNESAAMSADCSAYALVELAAANRPSQLTELVTEAKALCDIDYCFGEADRQAKERRAWVLISKLSKLEAQVAANAPADTVPLPVSADQAAGMVLVGTAWLKEHAPERLVAANAGQAPVKTCHEESLDRLHRHACEMIEKEMTPDARTSRQEIHPTGADEMTDKILSIPAHCALVVFLAGSLALLIGGFSGMVAHGFGVHWLRQNAVIFGAFFSCIFLADSIIQDHK